MIELDQARERIAPLEALFIEAHTVATDRWADLLEHHSSFALPLDATARANILNCHIRSEVERRVEGLPGVTATDLGFFALLIAEEILLRFKYVGLGLPSNYPTGVQRLLAQQLYPDKMLEALGGALPTVLTCGYTLDGAGLGRVEIRRDCLGHEPWSFDIFGGEALAEPLVFDGMVDDTKPAAVSSSETRRRNGALADQG